MKDKNLQILVMILMILCTNNYTIGEVYHLREDLNLNKNIYKSDSGIIDKTGLNITPIFQIDHIVAYEDSIPIYSIPDDISFIVGYLTELRPIRRFEFFALENGNYVDFDINAKWFPVEHDNDTGWVYRYDNVSLQYDVDTFNNVVLLNKISLAEIWGIGYINTQVRSIKSNRNILNKYLNLECCFELNDSLYIFNLGYDSIKVYNSNSESFIYNCIGGVNTKSEMNNIVYYLRWSADSIGKYGCHYRKDIPCQLIKYNYTLNTDTVLYVEHEIKKRPYYWGPDFRNLTDIKFKTRNDSLFVLFDLYKMKPNPIYEWDFILYNNEIYTE